jgi:hypothetical protein
MAFLSAGSARIDRLFHYQPFDAKRLSPIVVDNTLYFSDPRHFNDPWDCKPWFNVELLDNPDDLARHIQWYIDISRRRGGISEVQIQSTAARYKSDIPLFRSKIKEVSESMAQNHRRSVSSVLPCYQAQL